MHIKITYAYAQMNILPYLGTKVNLQLLAVVKIKLLKILYPFNQKSFNVQAVIICRYEIHLNFTLQKEENNLEVYTVICID